MKGSTVVLYYLLPVGSVVVALQIWAAARKRKRLREGDDNIGSSDAPSFAALYLLLSLLAIGLWPDSWVGGTRMVVQVLVSTATAAVGFLLHALVIEPLMLAGVSKQ